MAEARRRVVEGSPKSAYTIFEKIGISASDAFERFSQFVIRNNGVRDALIKLEEMFGKAESLPESEEKKEAKIYLRTKLNEFRVIAETPGSDERRTWNDADWHSSRIEQWVASVIEERERELQPVKTAPVKAVSHIHNADPDDFI